MSALSSCGRFQNHQIISHPSFCFVIPTLKKTVYAWTAQISVYSQGFWQETKFDSSIYWYISNLKLVVIIIYYNNYICYWSLYRKRCPKGHGTSSMITYSGALPDVDSGINRAKILIVLLKADRRLLGFNNIIMNNSWLLASILGY